MNASTCSHPVLRRFIAIAGLLLALAPGGFAQVLSIRVTSTAGTVTQGTYLAVVRSNNVATLSGTNTWPGTAKVLVNGVEASYTPIDGHWFATMALAAGLNRPLIQAVDAGGIPLFTTNTIIVSDVGSTTVGGTISSNTIWSPAMGIIRMTNNITVSGGATLDIQPGTVVLVGTGFNLRATNNSTLNILGTDNQIVGLFPMDASSNWGEIAADGTNSFLTVQHAETIGGAVKGRNDATCLLENSFFHDYKNGNVPIGGCTSARSMTVRRCHFRIYHETLWQNTLMMVEECLFELANNPSSDALDFDGAIVGSEIRRCTFRHGPQSNTDAIDIGPTTTGSGSTNTFIHDNLMFDFPFDKGVSIGEGSYGIIVSNCLIYGNDSGVAVKDSPGGKPPCTANIFNCTIVDCDYGYRVYNKSMPASPTNGGQITNSYNNIIWAPRIATFEILNAGIVVADHSDFGGTNWPGTGNFEANPLFLNAAQRDYRLATNSPCIGTGRNGATLGTHFPVGSPMAPSHPVLSSIEHVGNNALVKFWVDSEKTYSLLCTTNVNGGPWVKVADAFPYPTARLFTVTNSTAGNTNRFYRLVSPRIP